MGLPPHGAPPSNPRRQPRWLSYLLFEPRLRLLQSLRRVLREPPLFLRAERWSATRLAGLGGSGKSASGSYRQERGLPTRGLGARKRKGGRHAQGGALGRVAQRRKDIRRPPLRVRPPRGRGTGREGLLAQRADKAALCAGLESRVRPAKVWRKEIFSRVLDFLAENPLSALRAVRKERHPEMPCARSRPGIRPSGGFVAYLAVDHQMTPTLFARLFALRAPALLTGGSAVGIRFAAPPSLRTEPVMISAGCVEL